MLMLALFGGVSLAAHGQTTPRPCPPTTPIAGETAMKPFAPGRFKWFKDRYHLHDVNYASIRPLGNGQNAHDERVCAALTAQLHGPEFDATTTSRTYFDAGGYYLAVFIDRRDPATTPLWFPHVFVLKKNMELVAVIAPK